MSQRLPEKVAVVTAGASGIGLGIVRRFVAEGAHVVIGDIDVDGMARAVAELGGGVATARTDATNEADIEALVTMAVERFGHLDIAVANAGGGTFSPIVEHELSEWQRVLDLCLTSAFLTIKHAGARVTDGGSIITIASLNAVQAAEGMSAYCTAKAGVAMLSRVAAMELGHRGVRVNAIAPGLVETPMSAGFWAIPGMVEEFVENTTVGRFASPDDIAALALFLASDESSFVSGSLYAVDGGAANKRYPDLPGAFARFSEPLPN